MPKTNVEPKFLMLKHCPMGMDAHDWIIVRKLRKMQMVNPIILLVIDETMKMLFQGLTCVWFDHQSLDDVLDIYMKLTRCHATVEGGGWTHDLLVSIGQPYQLSYIHLCILI